MAFAVEGGEIPGRAGPRDRVTSCIDCAHLKTKTRKWLLPLLARSLSASRVGRWVRPTMAVDSLHPQVGQRPSQAGQPLDRPVSSGL